jgi:Spy/CpxP family protein refolding chaperone
MGAGGGHHGMSSFFGGRGFERLARHLELTEEQRTQAQAIHEATRDQVQPIRERSMELHGELRELLEQPAPDAAAVGTLVIAVHANRDQIRQLHEEARASFEAILTAEQLAKLGELEARRDERRGGRGERGERGKGKGRGAGGGLS